MNTNSFFDEKEGKWIRFYKGLTVAFFWILIIFGFIGGIGDASGEFLDIMWDDNFGEFLLWVVVCGVIAFVQLVTNMLVIQLLHNVQIIREKAEKE